MRKGKVLEKRLARIRLANAMLEWLKEGVFLNNNSGGILGSHTAVTVIRPFARDNKCEVFDAWGAWNILSESNRRLRWPGSAFEVVSFEPIVADEDGEIANWRAIER